MAEQGLTNQQVLENITAKFGESIFNVEEPYGLLTVTTTRDKIIPLLTHLLTMPI
jgi:NADH-quinone oxidoreductase subunit C